MANPNPRIDWQVVHLEYRANLLSTRQIADRHGITEGAIRKRAKRDGWVRDLSSEIRDVAEDMVRKSEAGAVDPVRTGPRTIPERETILASASAIVEQKLRTRKQIRQSQTVFDDLIGELTAINTNLDDLRALGEMLRSPDNIEQEKAFDSLSKAISLPNRFAMLKTATDAMKNIQAVSRLEYGLDKASATDDSAPKLTQAQMAARLAWFLERAGMKVSPKDVTQ